MSDQKLVTEKTSCSKENSSQYPHSKTVCIPMAILKPGTNYLLQTNKIASRTNTLINCQEVPHRNQVAFNIYGFWRDCLQAGRLLWYHLIKKTTTFIHSSFIPYLNQPLEENEVVIMKNLYKRVKYKEIPEFNLIEISGPFWDVLKLRKELFKRIQAKKVGRRNVHMMDVQKELIALKILRSIRENIVDDINLQESLYNLRNSYLLTSLTGLATTIDGQGDLLKPQGNENDSMTSNTTIESQVYSECNYKNTEDIESFKLLNEKIEMLKEESIKTKGMITNDGDVSLQQKQFSEKTIQTGDRNLKLSESFASFINPNFVLTELELSEENLSIDGENSETKLALESNVICEEDKNDSHPVKESAGNDLIENEEEERRLIMEQIKKLTQKEKEPATYRDKLVHGNDC